MKISPELESKLIAMGGVYGKPANVEEPPAKTSKRKPAELVTPGIAIEPERVTILVAMETVNPTNGSSDWKAKSRRAGAAWRRVREAVGPNLGALEPFSRHYENGGALRVRFVRIGGRALDMSNIPPATKGCEDAIAFLLNANDGDPRWHPEWDCVPGGAVGVEITLEVWR